jgi:ferredoxin
MTAPQDEVTVNLNAGGWRLHRYNRFRKHQTRERQAQARGNAGMSGKLKIHVDQDKCQGHARCKSLAPELFELDQFGNAHEIGDGYVPARLEDKAWLAQTNCPEIAIDVTEE